MTALDGTSNLKMEPIPWRGVGSPLLEVFHIEARQPSVKDAVPFDFLHLAEVGLDGLQHLPLTQWL